MQHIVRRGRPLARQHDLFAPFFADDWFFRPFRLAFPDAEAEGWRPPVDVEETDTEIVVRASAPGYAPEDITVTTDDGDLVIEGARDAARDDEDARYVVRERRSGRFYRRIPLPAAVAAADASARYAQGVLTVRIPKAAEARTTAIEVESA